MVDGVFFVNSALNVKQLSVFNIQQRYEQTIKTIESIKNYCPNNKIILFDGSFELPKKEYIDHISSMNVIYLHTGDNTQIKQFSSMGHRSLAESLSFIIAADYFKKNYINCKRIYKISGRYVLNNNFILNDDKYKDAFVFLPPLDSWMSKEKQEFSGVDKLFRIRLWHMDSSLFDVFQSKMPSIFNNCFQYDIDVEHSYYKNLNMYKTVVVDPIGVEGVIAPTGEKIYE